MAALGDIAEHWPTRARQSFPRNVAWFGAGKHRSPHSAATCVLAYGPGLMID